MYEISVNGSALSAEKSYKNVIIHLKTKDRIRVIVDGRKNMYLDEINNLSNAERMAIYLILSGKVCPPKIYANMKKRGLLKNKKQVTQMGIEIYEATKRKRNTESKISDELQKAAAIKEKLERERSG